MKWFKRAILQIHNCFVLPLQPDSFVHKGKTYVDGKDYFGKHDRNLILRWGEHHLNFCPSTPPQFR